MRLNNFSFRIRAYIIYIVFLGASLIIGIRLFILQLRYHEEYLAKAESQHQSVKTVEPERGEIFLQDKNGTLQPIAVNKYFPYLYVVPKEIDDPELVVDSLSEILNIPEDIIKSRVNKPNDPYELIAKRISTEAVKKITALNLKGIYIGEERLRFYPFGKLAADVIGFTKLDDNGYLKGEYGIEAKYDEILRGRPGIINTLRDPAGNVFLQFQSSLPEPGASLILTLDPNVQFKVEEILEETIIKWDAVGGNAIVLEANSGKILALADYPTFDPNEFSKEKNLLAFKNDAVSSRFEPGSVFKAITMAIALAKSAITPQTTYYDHGELKIGGYTIRNSDLKAHGTVTMTKVLQESYNTGAVFAKDKVGNEAFRDFLANILLLEEKTGIDLPAEIRGDLSGLWPPYARPINFATAAFGQGIALTSIKIAQIFAAFANGGNLIQPRIVSSIKFPDGRIESSKIKIIKENIIPEDILSDLTAMLTAVIDEGTGRRAKIKGYTIAGKTGTAQIPNPKAGYSEDTIHTFAVYTPYTNPPFVVFVRVDRPKGVRYAEGSVVPAAREILEFILRYYAIPPDKPEELQ